MLLGCQRLENALTVFRDLESQRHGAVAADDFCGGLLLANHELSGGDTLIVHDPERGDQHGADCRQQHDHREFPMQLHVLKPVHE